jgi:hypothetical protein
LRPTNQWLSDLIENRQKKQIFKLMHDQVKTNFEKSSTLSTKTKEKRVEKQRPIVKIMLIRKKNKNLNDFYLFWKDSANTI